MPQLVQVFVVLPLIFTMLSWRDNTFHALLFGIFYNAAAIICTVCEEILCAYSVNQGISLFAIVRGTCCNKYSDRHTMRIHGQMYFAVEPPFVRPMS